MFCVKLSDLSHKFLPGGEPTFSSAILGSQMAYKRFFANQFHWNFVSDTQQSYCSMIYNPESRSDHFGLSAVSHNASLCVYSFAHSSAGNWATIPRPTHLLQYVVQSLCVTLQDFLQEFFDVVLLGRRKIISVFLQEFSCHVLVWSFLRTNFCFLQIRSFLNWYYSSYAFQWFTVCEFLLSRLFSCPFWCFFFSVTVFQWNL